VVLGAVSAIDELILDLDAVQQTLDRSGGDPALYAEAVDIEQQARRLRDLLKHSKEQDELRFPGPLSIDKRVSVADWGKTTTLYGPTATQMTSLEIANSEYQQIGPQVRKLIDVRFVELKRNLDAAGVPWTPSRGVPVAD
jgi:hypothetical protein